MKLVSYESSAVSSILCVSKVFTNLQNYSAS